MVNNIQILRAFAALIVVWRHLQNWFVVDPGFGLRQVGLAGVDIFFVISGFIMFHTTRNNDRTPVQFWGDRVIRIAPTYWLLTFFIVGLYLAGLPAVDIQRLEFNDGPLSLLFIPNVRGDEYPVPILPVGWTLIFEMYFYGLFGLTFFLRTQAKALALLTAFFVAFFLLSVFVALPFTFSYLAQPITLEFAAGGLLALLYRRTGFLSAQTGRIAGYGLVLIGAIALLVGAANFGEGVSEATLLRTLVFGPPAVMIVAGALTLERSGVIWRSRIFLLLGAASYSIYLVHAPVLQYAALLWEALSPASPQVLLPAFLAASSVVAILAGVALHFAFEKPVTAFLKSRLKHRSARPVAAT